MEDHSTEVKVYWALDLDLSRRTMIDRGQQNLTTSLPEASGTLLYLVP